MKLVNKELENNNIYTNTNTGIEVLLPYFDENFLNRDNSKNSVLGKVMNNTAFPFTKKTDNEIDYWEFDSSKTTLQMLDRTGKNDQYEYVLRDVGSQNWSTNLDSTSTSTGTPGYFPLNKSAKTNQAATYNYGFGTKFEFNIKLDDNGYVQKQDGTLAPITFEFTGDDDMWVYIDDKLVMDLGGDHSQTSGKIDLSKDGQKAYMTSIKKNTENSSIESGTGQIIDLKTLFPNDELYSGFHKVTIFYMERGMWESNLKLRFNMPQIIMPEDLELIKTDFENQEIKLQGAIFELRDKNKNLIQTSTTDEDGHITLKGLSPDSTYYLKKVKAPKEYQIQDEEIEIKVSATGEMTSNIGTISNENDKYSLTITNKKNSLLPTTGGKGPIIYTFIGLLLIIISLVLINIKNKKDNKKKKDKIEVLEIIAIVFAAIFMFNPKVNAKDLDNTNIIEKYENSSISINDTKAKLYKIANRDKDKITYLNEYEKKQINIYGLNSSELTTYSKKLKNYIEENNLKEYSKDTTSKDGEFSFNDLSPGLYMIIVDDKQIDNYLYKALPSIIILPSSDNKNNNLKVFIKSERSEVTKEEGIKTKQNIDVPNTYDNILKYCVIFILSVSSIIYLIRKYYYDFEGG